MNGLEELVERLDRNFSRRPGDGAHWREAMAMGSALAAVRSAFGERLEERRGPLVNRSLLAYRLNPASVSFPDLKRICLGVARPADWEGRRLLDDDRLFARLLEQVATLAGKPTRWQACIRALLVAWLDLQDDHPTHRPGEKQLHASLSAAIPRLAQAARRYRWAADLIALNRLPDTAEERERLRRALSQF